MLDDSLCSPLRARLLVTAFAGAYRDLLCRRSRPLAVQNHHVQPFYCLYALKIVNKHSHKQYALHVHVLQNDAKQYFDFNTHAFCARCLLPVTKWRRYLGKCRLKSETFEMALLRTERMWTRIIRPPFASLDISHFLGCDGTAWIMNAQ